jgi:hypothetical protein
MHFIFRLLILLMKKCELEMGRLPERNWKKQPKHVGPIWVDDFLRPNHLRELIDPVRGRFFFFV